MRKDKLNGSTKVQAAVNQSEASSSIASRSEVSLAQSTEGPSGDQMSLDGRNGKRSLDQKRFDKAGFMEKFAVRQPQDSFADSGASPSMAER